MSKSGCWITCIYFLLLCLAIPWYWPADNHTLLLGMPAWVTLAIIVSILTSIFTAFILLKYKWPGEEESGDDHQD